MEGGVLEKYTIFRKSGFHEIVHYILQLITRLKASLFAIFREVDNIS